MICFKLHKMDCELKNGSKVMLLCILEIPWQHRPLNKRIMIEEMPKEVGRIM
jgi:hypothetical protein